MRSVAVPPQVASGRLVPQHTAPVDLVGIARSLPGLWSPQVVGQVNDHLLKVVRIAGEFPWHTHDTEDELFLVLEGLLHIGRAPEDGGPLVLRPGESFIVPRGVHHNTATPPGTETLLALVEPASTLHTGSEQTDRTRSLADQLQGQQPDPLV